MTETESLALLAVAGTLLGATIGVLGTYFVSVRLARNHAKTIAKLRLRDAFMPELTKLQTSDDVGVAEIPNMLGAAFPKHQTAINEFRFFLNGNNLDAFDKAWREYHYDPNEITPKFIQYSDEVDPDRQVVMERIQAILDFTRQ